MDTQLLLALDAGTGSFRAVLYNRFGQQLALNQIEWHHKPDPRYPGSIDFDVRMNWEIIIRCIQELISTSNVEPKNIIGISTTSMREGFVLYDENLQELLAFSNVDARSAQEAIELKKIFPELEQELYQETGQTFALSAIPRLLWVKNKQPKIYKEIRYINMLNDWIIFKLTGKIVSEPSNSSTSGLFDLRSRQWLPKVAQKCGLKTDIFPDVFESGSFVATVSEQAAQLTGLATSTKVIAGGGDAQLGCIGVGSVSENQAVLFGGSFWQFEFNTSQTIVDPSAKIRVNCHAVPETWQLEAIAWSAGLAMRWFRDAFCQAEQALAKSLNTSVYTLLDEQAAKIPAGSNGMITTFADIMNFKNLKHAAPTFTNFTIDPANFNKYTFYRSIMENAGLISYGHLKLVSELIEAYPEEVIFAGGSSYSPLWCQIICDILGVPLKTPKEKEATALGTAMLAGVGSGLFTTIIDAGEMVQFDNIYRPNRKNHELYKEVYKKWKSVYQAQLKLSDQAVTNYMWIAPGAK